jgi:hypothetical protein
LSIAKWIADVRHARPPVESKREAGSVFKIAFPVHALSEI